MIALTGAIKYIKISILYVYWKLQSASLSGFKSNQNKKYQKMFLYGQLIKVRQKHLKGILK